MSCLLRHRKMRKIFLTLYFILGSLAILGNITISYALSSENVLINNCEMSFNYDKSPRRAITVNQNPTEVMLSLNLENVLIGTAYLDDEILPSLKKAYDRIPILSDTYPSREVVLAQRPDFIYAGFPGAFTNKVLGTREELIKLGISTYISPSLCPSRRDLPLSLQDIFREILEIGKIFRVENRAKALISSMEREIEFVKERLKDIEHPKKVFYFDTWGTVEEVPLTAGCCGVPHLLIALAKGKNIFEDLKAQMTHVSWEVVMERNPEIIVMNEARWSSAKRKIEFLQRHPVLKNMKAVRENRFVIIPASATMAGVRVSDTVLKLAKSFYPNRF